MNGNASVSQYIYIYTRSGSTLVEACPVMKEAVGSSPVINKDFPYFSFLFVNL